jgi:hypothetical protein
VRFETGSRVSLWKRVPRLTNDRGSKRLFTSLRASRRVRRHYIADEAEFRPADHERDCDSGAVIDENLAELLTVKELHDIVAYLMTLE